MDQWIQWSAAVLGAVIGLIAVMLRPRGIPAWSFFIGMLLLAAERVLEGRLMGSIAADSFDRQAGYLMGLNAVIAPVWLFFSLTYARGNRNEFIRRWAWVLVAGLAIPLVLLAGVLGEPWHVDHSSREGRSLHLSMAGNGAFIAILILHLGILLNLEKTFRASVGMSRWRIKYLFLGAGLIFGVKLYTLSQSLLYSSYPFGLADFNGVAVVLGAALIAVGHSRSSFGQFDLYPSRALLQGSLTVLLAGIYFLIIGLLAQVAGTFGGTTRVSAQPFLILVGLVGSIVILLSDRFQAAIQRFVSQHLHRPEHDFRKLWTDFTRRTSSALAPGALGKDSAEFVSENFHVLGVSILRWAPDGSRLEWIHSTASTEPPERGLEMPKGLDEDLRSRDGAIDIEREPSEWAAHFRRAFPKKFEHGGNRLVLPLIVADRFLGVMVLTDRVNGVPYSHEELDLLKCIADQLAAGLLNSTLTEQVLQAKELEAFQTLSTFFVHDLKNAANSLSLTLKNLPVHFDDPEFRADAVRAVGRTVERINKMILNLGSLRDELQLRPAYCRLDFLAAEVLDELSDELNHGGRLERNLRPVPELRLDRQAVRNVLANLVVNAREALNGTGTVRVTTVVSGDEVELSVEDDGCGMSEEFVRNQLFRPFRSTKSKGLGIGMFQCKKIVEAHRGAIRVESEPGRGTRFVLRLPVDPHLSEPKPS